MADLTPEEIAKMDEQLEAARKAEQSPMSEEEMMADAEAWGAEYDKYDAPIQAFAEGVARGTVPLFDQIATKGLGVDPKGLRLRKEISPIASATGEVAGFVGGPGKIVVGAEKALAKAIGKSFANQAEKKIARKIMENAAATGLAGMPTGAAMGANQLINESALGEADLTAENMLAYAGTGAVLSGLVGGAFGGFEAAMPAIKTAANRATGQLKRIAPKVVDPIENAATLLAPSKVKRSELVSEWRSIGATDDEVLKFLKDDLKVSLGQTPEERLERYFANKAQVQSELNAAYDKLDDITGKFAVRAADLDQRLADRLNRFALENKEMLDTPANRRAYEAVWRDVEGRGLRFKKDAVESFSGLRELRQKYDNMAKFDKDTPTFAQKIYRELGREVRGVLEDAAAAAGSSTPEASEVFRQVKALNRRVQISAPVENYLTKKAATGPDLVSAKEAMIGIVGAAAGDLTSAAALVGLKKALESDIKAQLVVLNTGYRANQRAKDIISSIVDGVRGAAQKADPYIAPTARKVFVDSGLAVSFDEKKRPKPAQNEKEAWLNIRKNLNEYAADREKLITRMAAATLKTSKAAPQITAAMHDRINRAVDFLYSKLPRSPNAEMDVINKDNWQPSSMELAKFQRYVQAVEHPFSLASDLASGKATMEQVEAVATVYPRLYNEIKLAILPLLKPDSGLSYNKRLAAAKLLQVPLDSSMQPRTVAALQTTFMPEEEKEAPTAGAVNSTVGGMKEINKARRTATETQSFLMGSDE